MPYMLISSIWIRSTISSGLVLITIEEKVVRIKAVQNDLYKWERADTEMHMEIISIYENERINRIYRSNQDELIRIGLMSQKGSCMLSRLSRDCISLWKQFVKSVSRKLWKFFAEIILRLDRKWH